MRAAVSRRQQLARPERQPASELDPATHLEDHCRCERRRVVDGGAQVPLRRRRQWRHKIGAEDTAGIGWRLPACAPKRSSAVAPMAGSGFVAIEQVGRIEVDDDGQDAARALVGPRVEPDPFTYTREFLEDVTVSRSPSGGCRSRGGLSGGEAGAVGENWLLQQGTSRESSVCRTSARSSSELATCCG
jgi:hypothetical protein